MKNRLIVMLVFLVIVLSLAFVASQYDKAQASASAPADSDNILVWQRRCPTAKVGTNYYPVSDKIRVTCYRADGTIFWEKDGEQAKANKRFVATGPNSLPGLNVVYIEPHDDLATGLFGAEPGAGFTP